MKNEKKEVIRGRRLSNAESYEMNLGNVDKPTFQTLPQKWLNEILDKLNAIPLINPIPKDDIEKLFISSNEIDEKKEV